MAERYDFYVRDNRKVTFNLTEPIMQEDSGVTDFVFHIPKIINDLEVSDWAWWFVFVNAKKEKYSIALTLSDDPERPLEYNLATYTVDYAMSIKAGSVQFAFEAINTGTGGAIDNEWHTESYGIKVKETLQGNQVEYVETESDIISALLIEVRNKVNQLVGGATPLPVASVSAMTDTTKVYLNTTDKNWYLYNGSAWVSGGVYGAGVTDSVPTQGSTNAVSSGGVYSALAGKVDAVSGKGLSTNDYTDADKENVDEIGTIKTAVDMVVTTEEDEPTTTSSQIVDLTGYSLTTYKDQYDYYANVNIPFTKNAKFYMNPWGACNLTRVKAYDSNDTLLSYGDSLTTFTTNQFSSIERVNNTTIKKIQGSTNSKYDSSPTETLYEYGGNIAYLVVEMIRNIADNRATLLGLAEERSTTYIPFEERGEPTYRTVYNPDMAEYVHDYIEENYPESDISEDLEELTDKVDNYTETASLINLYDKSLAIDGSYYNSSQQKVISGNANYGFSGYIPVKPNMQYNISCDKDLSIGMMGSYYQEWTADKTLIQNTQQPYALRHISQIQTGATTAFISINFSFGQAHTTEQFNALIDTVMLCYGMMRPLEYSAYNSEPTINHEKIDIMRQLNADRFRGKKWLVTGTSVSYQDSKVYTEGVAEGELVRGYIGNVSRCKPMLIRNEGISGSTLADTTQDTALINRYQNLNFADYDFITIEYGINDFGRNVPVGTAQDAAGTSTFSACLKTIIEYALAQNPIVGLIICTDPDVRGATTNQNGNTLKDYADVTLEVAKLYRLPVCDWFYHSGINALTRGDGTSRYALTQAGTHPSVYGHMRMGAMLNQVFDSLLC